MKIKITITKKHPNLYFKRRVADDVKYFMLVHDSHAVMVDLRHKRISKITLPTFHSHFRLSSIGERIKPIWSDKLEQVYTITTKRIFEHHLKRVINEITQNEIPL